MFDKVIKLCRGAGNGIDQACLVTASNMLIGKGHLRDAATCQCELVSGFIVYTNDILPDEIRQKYYGPLVYEILGTRTDDLKVRECRSKLMRALCGGITPVFDHEYSSFYGRCCAQRLERTMLITTDIDERGMPISTIGRVNNSPNIEEFAQKCVDIIRRVLAVGDKRPVETVISVDKLAEVLI